MKIMFNYGSMYMGGAERVISSLANNFVERGAVVSIMVTDSLPSGYPLDKRVRFINQNASTSSSGMINAIKNNLRRVILTRKYLQEIQPDLVICFGINNLTMIILARSSRNMRTIGSERSNPYLASEGRFWKLMKRIVSPCADGYIFSTEGAQKYYPKWTQKKSVIIPNGIFADSLPEHVPPLRQRNGKQICAVGRLDPVKGFDSLIHAFARFHENYPEYTLHIYGEGRERANLTALIHKLDLESSVILEGYCADIPGKLCESIIFCFSSLYEGMPNALIEAMACGLPCVSARCDFGPTELIIDGENGLLVPVGDVEAMSKAMERIAADSALANKLSKNALKIRETHSRERISELFYNYITSIMTK